MHSASPESGKNERQTRIVILGAGFGGLFAARRLKHANARVTVIDRHNYHLFQPLLYQVAGAALSPSDIGWPIRSLLARQANTRVVMAEVMDIDTDEHRVVTDRGDFNYDFLVVATGARTSYFGNHEWSRHSFGLKDLGDAIRIREQVLKNMERAETSADSAVRRRLLTFIMIGGGPTGVEMAGIIAELGKFAVASDFRKIRDEEFRVVLVEGSQRLLGALPNKLGHYAAYALGRLGVDVKTGLTVEHIDADGARFSDGSDESGTVIWCAGVETTPAGRWLGFDTKKDGRIPVNDDLSLPGLPEVFVIGDLALLRDSKGRPLPGIAPVAKQQGRFVAGRLKERLSGKVTGKSFRYRDFGMMATIGRGRAVADFNHFNTTGWLTWWIWGLSHIYFLIARPARLLVAIKWLFEYVTFKRGSRLILK